MLTWLHAYMLTCLHVYMLPFFQYYVLLWLHACMLERWHETCLQTTSSSQAQAHNDLAKSLLTDYSICTAEQ